jgi:hypothetical protein
MANTIAHSSGPRAAPPGHPKQQACIHGSSRALPPLNAIPRVDTGVVGMASEPHRHPPPFRVSPHTHLPHSGPTTVRHCERHTGSKAVPQLLCSPACRGSGGRAHWRSCGPTLCVRPVYGHWLPQLATARQQRHRRHVAGLHRLRQLAWLCWT